ncbi:MAG: 4-hydroxy-3-methylbut-2-enyl diphosphate reductase [Spirochaetaceae bacterium]|nr:4-hydroxy-3-methylbut-2-enyl diphosphate reductase [Spirochaetaceae bacterium]
MQIIKAKVMGYCTGVKLAINKAEAALREGPVYSLGALIHNKAEMERLKLLGLKVINANEVPPAGATAMVRAHGLHPQKRQELLAAGVTLIDATCPFVLNNQHTLQSYNTNGYFAIIIGQKEHAEITALVGFSHNYVVISTVTEAEQLVTLAPKIVVMAQTTFDKTNYEHIKEVLANRYTLEAPPSICPAPLSRLKALEELSPLAEALVIIGDKDSANSLTLCNKALSLNKNSFLVEKESDFDKIFLKNYHTIGLAASASSPSWLINNLELFLQED